ncbi:MAG TPA: GIY-YIG nuclease family protein [Gammaproteobacteria bacterium]|nr:GIY-YIG nuclease family protein [Gammaproteobacteria bacterium]
MPHAPLTKTDLARRIRAAAASHVVDAPHGDGEGAAIYTLADPRDLAAVRYVGQTRAPRRRFAQHLGSARLWMPDEIPWWIASPRLRPLYTWIRELHRDDFRLPVMVVSAWVERSSDARSAERALIERCLRQGAALLNIEAERAGPQIPLL